LSCQVRKEYVIMSARMQNKLMFVDKAMLSSNLTAIRRFR
jgi:hypothetical protein